MKSLAGNEKLKKSLGGRAKDYPQKNRFCSVVDFRKMDDKWKNNEDKEENLLMFQAQDGGDEVHDNMNLTYFHNSKKNIIPNPKSKGNDDVGDKVEPILAARTTGPQLTLSFHVDALDNMRCYLYINGQCARFMPPDIKMVLPRFFDDSDVNKKFVDSERIDKIIDGLDGKLRDDIFQAFLDENKVECPWKTEFQAKQKKN